MNWPPALQGISTILRDRLSSRPGFRRSMITTGILMGAFLVAGLIVATGPEPRTDDRKEKAWPVSVVTANPVDQAPTLVIYGRVESNQVANLKTSINAVVDEVVTPEGSFVEKGQVLVRLEQEELRLLVDIAEARTRNQQAQLESVRTARTLAERLTAHEQELNAIAQAKLERHMDLYARGMISDAIMDEVREQASQKAMALEQHLARLRDFPNRINQQLALLTEAEAQLAQARLNLAQTGIEAPFAGRIMETLVSPGDRVLPGVPVIRIAGHEGIEVRASIPADIGSRLRGRLREGQRILSRGTLDGESLTFELARMSGDVKNGQTGIDAFFRPVDGTQLDIGRVVNLNVIMPKVEYTVALPLQSIYENGRIYRVENNRLVGLEVDQVGDLVAEDGSYQVLVHSPQIRPGDTLVTTQLPRAITGLLVEPQDPDAFATAQTLESSPVPQG